MYCEGKHSTWVLFLVKQTTGILLEAVNDCVELGVQYWVQLKGAAKEVFKGTGVHFAHRDML
jgi:hypothetical protein